MRVDKVNPTKGIGYIKFNTDTEMDLIAESMDRLIKKQEKIMERTGGELAEVKKLERFQQSKDVVIEIPRQNRIRMRALTNQVRDNHEKQSRIKGIKPGMETDDVEDTEEFKNMNKVMADAEEGSGLAEGAEVTHRNMHVLVNAINQHICDMEKDGFYKKTRRNQQKYEKLQQMLENAQQQKARFERVTPKPTRFGRLRK